MPVPADSVHAHGTPRRRYADCRDARARRPPDISNVPLENLTSSTLATQDDYEMSSKAEFSIASAVRHRSPYDSTCVEDLYTDKEFVDIILNYDSKAALVTDK